MGYLGWPMVVLALWVGACLGVVIMALLAANREDDEDEETDLGRCARCHPDMREIDTDGPHLRLVR